MAAFLRSDELATLVATPARRLSKW